MLNPPRKISIQVPETSIKPRSRFSQLEDAVICEGVAKGLSWGEISAQLPHRKVTPPTACPGSSIDDKKHKVTNTFVFM